MVRPLSMVLGVALAGAAVPPALHRSLRFRPEAHFLSNTTAVAQGPAQECGRAVPTSAGDIKNFKARCPSECPLFVDDHSTGTICDFTCVSNSIQSCQNLDPDTPVPDLEKGVCRRCQVVGCQTCFPDGTERCKQCLDGYQLKGDGRCGYTWPFFIGYCCVVLLVFVIGVGAVLVVGWLVDLLTRDVTNKEGLEYALKVRSRAKIHMPKDKESQRVLWPLSTNLCHADVAGPAVTLLFNFQAAIILWALVLAVSWYVVASSNGTQLLEVGNKVTETVREVCIAMKWGHKTQHALMYVKLCFLIFAYVFSFLGAILFGIRQWRIFTTDNGDTHKDFCIVLTGLPKLPGSRRVEEELRAAIVEAVGTKTPLIGVAVGWEAGDKYNDLQEAMNFHISELETDRCHSVRETPGLVSLPLERPAVERARRRFHKLSLAMEGLFLHPVTQQIMTRGRQKKSLGGQAEAEPGDDQEKSFLRRCEASGETNLAASVVSVDAQLLKEAILDIHTAESAFAVFESENGRNEVLAMLKQDGLKFTYLDEEGKEMKKAMLQVNAPDYEPSAVLWQNLSSDHSVKSKLKKAAWMGGVILLTVFLLATFEYGYAIIQINNVRSSGEEGITLSFIIFTLLVVAMMAILCAVSATVADRVGFERVGHNQACFVLLYTFSVVMQVSLDCCIAYFVGKSLMEANGVRTHNGTLIEDLLTRTHFTEIFESYPMQKQLGITVLSFGFPCAFLVPFLFEPIVSIFVPFKISSMLVGSHPELKGHSAESLLEPLPMDLGRYGDIMINVIIASMIMWFPSGLFLTMFTFLACSHLYIYCLDHYRVLRSVKSIYISGYLVDWWAQWLFSIPCALIAAALTFQMNCEPYLDTYLPGMELGRLHGWGWGNHCDMGWNAWVKVILVFFGHILVHTWILFSFIPLFGVSDKEEKNNHYKVTAQRFPCSWFSGNLVHCLRSRYIYEHNPPFDMCVSGKEHVMRLNEEIGAHFQDDPAEEEIYDVKEYVAAARKSMFDTDEMPENS